MDVRPISNVFDTPKTAINTPLPPDDDEVSILEPPRASYILTDSARTSSYATATPQSDNNSGPLLLAVDKPESDEYVDQESKPAKAGRRRLILALIALAVLVVVALAVVLPVYFTVIKPNQTNTVASAQPPSGGGGSSGGGGGGGNTGNIQVTSGGDGSTVTTSDGSTFTYTNKFGGFWVDDPDDPFNNNAQANSWTPPLNQSWRWGKDRVYGVNLGGLFVLEPFITPALFQRYPGTVDEWSLSLQMAADTANGGINQIEEHYKTFITEQDIAEIAGAGLNWIRLPIPFWAIETWPGEPFLAKTSWKYILQVFAWCRKYGLRVNLDLHTVPGSANGYNHGGKAGAFNFLNGVMGIANAQRTMDYIRFITEFISQPQYKDVVLMFGIINEAVITTIGRSTLTSFYLETHNMIRGITGIGEGNGAYISIHDGFAGLSSWAGFLPNSDRIALDTHPYFAFSNSPATDPIDTGTGSGAGGVWPQKACETFQGINASQVAFGVTMAGEFSNGFNDCALYLKGVPGSYTYGGNCNDWLDSSNWTLGTKAGIKNLALAQMDVLQDWFFWTWKIGNSTAGIVESPLWSYQLGFQNGWMPTDPREAVGMCASLGLSGRPFDGTYPQPWMTGGVGAGAIVPSVTAEFPWLPSSLNADASVSLLPTYTPTGTIPTLPPPSLTPTPTKSVDVGNGWFNQQDTTGAMTPVTGCEYPDAWDAISAAVPPVCGGAPTITPAPARR